MTDTTPAVKEAKAERRQAPRWRRRLARNPLAIIGITIIALFLAVVAFAPFIAPYLPQTQDLRTTYLPPGTGVSLRGPEGQFGIWVSRAQRSPTRGIEVDDSARSEERRVG